VAADVAALREQASETLLYVRLRELMFWGLAARRSSPACNAKLAKIAGEAAFEGERVCKERRKSAIHRHSVAKLNRCANREKLWTELYGSVSVSAG
jgi:hypothetical protein